MRYYRRLDLKPEKKLRGRARYIRFMREDMDALTSWFPPEDTWAHQFVNVKVPVYEKILDDRHGGQDVRKELLQRLVDTAACVVQNKPKTAPYSRVAALISWPDLFNSEICVFFDKDYENRFLPENYSTHKNFGKRQNLHDGWEETHPVVCNLFTDKGIVIPEEFTTGGYTGRRYDEDFDEIYEWEFWTVMQNIPAIG